MTEASQLKTVPVAAITGGLLLGGSSTFLINLARGFQQFNHPLPIVCLSDTNEHEADFVRIMAKLSVMKDKRLIYEDRLAWAYAQIASTRPNAVLACLGAESFEILRLVPPGVMRVGLIQSDHQNPYATAASFAPWIDTIVGVSNEITQKLESMPEFGEKPVHTIPYGIYFDETDERQIRSTEEPLRVIYVGRLIEEQKRVSRLVTLAQKLESTCAPIRLTLAGSGPQEKELRAKLEGSSVARVIGEVSNAQVVELLRQHDVFILLSDYEGLPLALLEAMGYGLVPVVSDLPSGIREAVPEHAGIRIPPGDVDAAASALNALAVDSTRLSHLSKSAQRTAREHYSAKRMAGDYLKLVESSFGSAKEWPVKIRVPAPIGLNPFVFSGISRTARRWLRLILASARERSSRS
jgi:glycosyltransferase involved in cell wall biosynthesis